MNIAARNVILIVLCSLASLRGVTAAGAGEAAGPQNDVANEHEETAGGESSGANPASFKDAISLKNGDILFGHLESFDFQQGSRWRHTDVDQPIVFKPEDIAEIRFGRPQPAVPQVSDTWRVYLANEDVIEGRLLSITNEFIELDTLIAGVLKLPRNFVRIIDPVYQRKPPIYHGFDNGDDWVIGKVDSEGLEGGPWKYKNHAFYAFKAASLARDVNLPDVASIKMDIAWKGVLSLAIGLYTDSLQPISLLNKDEEPSFGGFYSLALYNQGAVLRGINQRDPIQQLGQVYIPKLNQKNFATFEILVHKEFKVILLRIDGETVHIWRETKDFMGEGTGLRFVHQGKGSVRISNLEVRQWDGHLESTPNLGTSTLQDALWLEPSEKRVGDVVGLKEGQIVLRVGEREELIPLGKVRRISLKRQADEELLSPESFPILHSRNHDRLTFQLKRIEPETVVGTYPEIGELSVRLNQVSRIELP